MDKELLALLKQINGNLERIADCMEACSQSCEEDTLYYEPPNLVTTESVEETPAKAERGGNVFHIVPSEMPKKVKADVEEPKADGPKADVGEPKEVDFDTVLSAVVAYSNRDSSGLKDLIIPLGWKQGTKVSDWLKTCPENWGRVYKGCTV